MCSNLLTIISKCIEKKTKHVVQINATDWACLLEDPLSSPSSSSIKMKLIPSTTDGSWRRRWRVWKGLCEKWKLEFYTDNHASSQVVVITFTSLFPTAIPISARSFSKDAIISAALFFWWLVISLSFWSSASILAKLA